MKEIKYSYCLNENNQLVHIGSVTKENRHSHTYKCMVCGQKLLARIGEYKVKHFAHAANTVCDGESYLHKLAKRRIREQFLSADSFPLTFVRDVPCQETRNCPFCVDFYCISERVSIPTNLRKWEGKDVYDTCQEEVKVEEFRPDLLLSCKNTSKPPVFIEIFASHKSEEQKVGSKYRIIETVKITSEAVIDNIIKRGFVEGENCNTFHFKPKLPLIKKGGMPIDRFVLFKNGASRVFDNDFTCDRCKQRAAPDSVMELNISQAVYLRGEDIYENRLNSYQSGLVYLRKKGLQFKNCILCKFYKSNYSGEGKICILYKKLGASTKRPQQSQASNCPCYEENPELMNYPLSELEKDITEVP